MPERKQAIEAAIVGVESTLGVMDKPGHFLPNRPNSQQLLENLRKQRWRIGAIVTLSNGTNGNKQVEYIETIRRGVLSEDSKTGKKLTIGDFIAPEYFVVRHSADVGEQDLDVYEDLAKKVGAEPEACVIVSQDASQILAAMNAGMKEYRNNPDDYPHVPVGKIDASPTDSGREFQSLLEHEHLLGERIFACGEKISAWIDKLIDVDAWNKQLAQITKENRWQGPPVVTVPNELKKAMAYMMYLLDHFADQVHLKAEEETFEFAVACGLDPKAAKWVFDQHNQVRAYWTALDIAWGRIREGDSDDRWFALRDFRVTTEAFVFLFKAHAIREDYQTYTKAGEAFNSEDDALAVNLIAHTGPSDITPYINMVGNMEKLLENIPANGQ